MKQVLNVLGIIFCIVAPIIIIALNWGWLSRYWQVLVILLITGVNVINVVRHITR